jgi:hypothetical protein
MCPHTQIDASLDRWTEAHWHIHKMEENFHSPDPFRYSANAFIRSLKEIPQILKMDLQNHTLYHSRIRAIIDQIYADPLFTLFSRKRDFIVHHGVLQLHSSGFAGTTEGRGFKIGAPFPVRPDESSDEAYFRFRELCRKNRDIRALLGPDCDSRPCIQRTWRIPELPNNDLLGICVDAWRVAGKTLSQLVELFGAEALDLTMSCRHDPSKVKMKVYSQREFFDYVDNAILTNRSS